MSAMDQMLTNMTTSGNAVVNSQIFTITMVIFLILFIVGLHAGSVFSGSNLDTEAFSHQVMFRTSSIVPMTMILSSSSNT